MSKRRLAVAAAVLAVVLAVVVSAVLAGKRRGGAGLPDRGPSVGLAVPPGVAFPAVWLEVHAPKRVFEAATRNAWLSRALAAPLGQGFAGSWSAFLGTKGEDLSAGFQGAVARLAAEKLLADPFRVVLYGGPGATGAPAILVPAPGAAARGAYAALDAVARRGTFEVPRCPGTGEPETAPAPGQEPLAVARWLLADHAVYAAERAGAFALSRHPVAALHALCAPPPAAAPTDGAHLDLAFSPDGLGREGRLLAELLGLGPAPRLAFSVEAGSVVPRGIAGELAAPGRLGAAGPPDELLRLVPADAGLVLLAALRLPADLGPDALAAHLRGAAPEASLKTREVAIVWNPRGDASLPTEVALLWPGGDDRRALRAIFSGPNALVRADACGHEILASTRALADALERACQGRVPSLLDAAPAVKAGLRAPASLGVGVNLGPALARALADAWAADGGKKKAAPPEIEEARRLLEELPFLGLRGTVKGSSLLPGGFRS
jgi:hypothetical protein